MAFRQLRLSSACPSNFQGVGQVGLQSRDQLTPKLILELRLASTNFPGLQFPERSYPRNGVVESDLQVVDVVRVPRLGSSWLDLMVKVRPTTLHLLIARLLEVPKKLRYFASSLQNSTESCQVPS